MRVYEDGMGWGLKNIPERRMRGGRGQAQDGSWAAGGAFDRLGSEQCGYKRWLRPQKALNSGLNN